MSWIDERLKQLVARRVTLSAQLESDKAEQCAEIREVRVALTNLQIAANEAHIELLKSFNNEHA